MSFRIISGGQTGADRGGLLAAIKLGLPHGGFCPKGRRAEDGTIPPHYNLTEVHSRNYQVRTIRNIEAAAGTLIFVNGELKGGSRFTFIECRQRRKPCKLINLSVLTHDEAVISAIAFLSEIEGEDETTVNIAGSRESSSRGIQDQVQVILTTALKQIDRGRPWRKRL